MVFLKLMIFLLVVGFNLVDSKEMAVGGNFIDFTDYLGGCCSGKNELGTLVNCAGKSSDVCINECKAKCAKMSNCASFETKQIATPGKCWGSTTCRINERPALTCGHNLYIKVNLEQFLIAEVEGNTISDANYWRSKCTIIPSTAVYITVHMGTIIDYFKPIDGATFCDMLQSYKKHMWSPDGLSWEQPVYYTRGVGGSTGKWIKDKDGRRNISFWGYVVTKNPKCKGGCCHYSKNDGTNTVDTASWGRKFNMYYYIDAIPTVIIPTEKYLLVGDGKCNSDNEIGGDIVTASPEDCRSHCIEHYETYFAMWTRAHDGASICTCYHDCDTQDSTDNSLVYEILSEHVSQIFADAKALLDHRDGQIDTLNSEISRLNSVIEEKNRIIADKDVEIAEKNDKIATLEASLTSEKAKKIKWKNRYEHAKSGVMVPFTEAEETYQSEQAIGSKLSTQSGGGAKNSTWFRSIAQITVILSFGIAIGFIMATKTKMVGEESISLL